MTTQVLGLMGLACLLAGTWGRFGLLRKGLPEIYGMFRRGEVQPAPPWQKALSWLGFALLVLSQWRACAGA